MPRIIPIKELKNTSEISDMCHGMNEPIYITKNGYGDMVIMSMESYEKTMYVNSVYEKLTKAEESVANGNVTDAYNNLEKHLNQSAHDWGK